jgi:kynureninase
VILDTSTLDRHDPLRSFADQFVPIEPGLIYLDGNSLGRMPLDAVEVLRRFETSWGSNLIRSWNDEWIGLPTRLAALLAPIIGADPAGVTFCDSTSVNLFKLASAAMEVQAGRLEIVSESSNFRSNLYVLSRLGELKVSDDPVAAISEKTALVSLSLVSFQSGERFDLDEVTRIAHQHDAMVLWDLSHAAGVVPVNLASSNADLAVGCSYKYLNGGPGAPAWLYVRPELIERLRSPIQGWFGDRRSFEFLSEYEPATGIDRFQAGTPPILSLAAIEPGLKMIAEAGIEQIWEKAQKLRAYFLWRIGKLAEIEPLKPAAFGSHVSVRHPAAWQVCQALIAANVVPDFRTPDLIRFGFSPLTTSFADVDEAVYRLEYILNERIWEQFPAAKSGVT